MKPDNLYSDRWYFDEEDATKSVGDWSIDVDNVKNGLFMVALGNREVAIRSKLIQRQRVIVSQRSKGTGAVGTNGVINFFKADANEGAGLFKMVGQWP